LLCDSGGGAADLSDFTATFACMMDGEEDITVLHVMSQISAGPGVEGKQLQANAEALIREGSPEGLVFTHDIEILDQPAIRPHPKVRHGFVVDEILREAREGDYDLVIIGAHLREGWKGMLLDDIAHKIVKRIDRSILAVH
jgi:nucleotide-binding universal stress UspA family protein